MTESPESVVSAYVPSPTLQRFHASQATFRGIRGPIGSGKSTGCVAELMMIALEQAPDKRGVRHTQFAVIRNTYPELKSTTIPTFRAWVPDEIATWRWDQPITCTVSFEAAGPDGRPDGTSVLAKFWFLSMDTAADLKKAKGIELTAAWLNEASELPWSVVEMVRGRMPRYPPEKWGVPVTRYGIIADTNPPDDDHWWYRLAEVERPEGYEFFSQPPAILWDGVNWQPNPAAENVTHQQIGYQYWLGQVPGATVEFIKTMLCGEYGGTQDGKPVYPQYSDQIHCAKEILRPDPSLPVLLGWDWGTTPACVIGQITPMGQLRITDELFIDNGTVRELAANKVRPLLMQDYAGCAVRGWGDPAGMSRESGGGDAFTTLREEQINVSPSPDPSNSLEMRIDAVVYFLNRMVEGQPGLLISPHCERLRKGFRGRYKFEKILTRLGSDTKYHTQPAKNLYSHTHDGLQYLCLGVRGVARTGGTRLPLRRRGNWRTL